MKTSLSLNSPITQLPLVGPAKARDLSRLEIRTIKDLIYHLPNKYKDTSELITIAELLIHREGTVQVVIDDVKLNFTRGRKAIVKAKISDETGRANVMWFNQKFIMRALKKGKTYMMQLKLPNKPTAKDFYCKDFELVKDLAEMAHLGRVSPIYPQTAGVSSKWLRARLKALKKDLPKILKDHLSVEILKEYDMPKINEAILTLHFPDDLEDLQKARNRVAFEEMLELAHKLEQRRSEREEADAFELPKDSQEEFAKLLEFDLTPDQEKSIKSLVADLKRPTPMNRLLNGDVGSGKTMVAMAGVLHTVRNEKIAIVMAPTTILAKQHYESFTQFFKNSNIKINLLTSDNHPEILDEPQIIIGTHAILFKEKLPKNIALVIIDEQHRFGVEQREQLVEQTRSLKPHYLTMTATPIPRTLTNVIYGDMDVSQIQEMPDHRLTVESHYVTTAKQKKGLEWVADKIMDSNGQDQAFVIFPLIEDSNKSKLKSAVSAQKELSKGVFSKLKVGLLHGRLDEEEKSQILNDFKNNKYNVLISTTVIEVGIDIPGATIIVIEHAERFGLAQLHQLRGRVGRSNKQSYCYIYPGKDVEEDSEAETRLQYFASHSSGFDVAEYDLQRRGPGEVYGLKQSGVPNFKVADISNLELLKLAREYVKNEGYKPVYNLLQRPE